jgi:hypothetical protein
MKNKELKKGGQIWIYSPWLGRNSSFPVKSVKKNGTLVTVVIEVSYLDKKHEATLYGHASSSMLSGYVRYYDFGHEVYFTCDFDLIEKWTNNRKRDEK